MDHWRNPKPCANAVVVDVGRVLLVRRARRDSPWYDAWCAPGGFCETGEHPIVTTEREVREETGYEVEILRYLGTWVDTYADDAADADADVINVAYYLAAPRSPTRAAIDPIEVSELGWFAWDELPRNLAPPGTLARVLGVARAAPADLPDRPR